MPPNILMFKTNPTEPKIEKDLRIPVFAGVRQ